MSLQFNVKCPVTDMREELPPAVFLFMEVQKWCLICANKHPTKECPDRWREPEEDDVANLIEWVRSYMEEHKKKKKTTRSGSHRASSSTSTPMSVDSYAPQRRSSKKNKK